MLLSDNLLLYYPMQKIETIAMLLLIGLVIVWVYIVSVLYLSPKAHSDSIDYNDITYIDTIRKRACLPDTDTRRVIFRDWSTGLRLDHMNMLYKASNYNKDIVMVAYKEAFRDKKRYSLTITWLLGEKWMCQVLPLWFRKYPEVFNKEFLTDVNAQIQWCLRLRHRAYEGDNLYRTRTTFRKRETALRYIEFID